MRAGVVLVSSTQLEADLAGHDALVHEVHAVLDQLDPVRDLAEVAEAELLLAMQNGQ